MALGSGLLGLGPWEEEEDRLRKRVTLMRELGVIQLFGMVLGPPPMVPTKLEKLEQKAAEEQTPAAIRDARIEAAREDFRAKLGNWELSAERIDPFLDPAIFELD